MLLLWVIRAACGSFFVKQKSPSSFHRASLNHNVSTSLQGEQLGTPFGRMTPADASKVDLPVRYPPSPDEPDLSYGITLISKCA